MSVSVLVGMLAAAVYELFAGQFSADELGAAGVCGLVAALWSASLRRAGPVRFRFEEGTFGAVARAVGGLPAATGGVALVLGRAIAGSGPAAREPGHVVHKALVPGRRRDQADAGRRAIAVLAQSLAPDSFVVRTPEAREEIEVHQLVARSTRANARWGL